MKTNIKFKQFNEVINIIIKANICDSIILFGSATNSSKPHDYDIMLYREKKIYTPYDMIKIIELLNEIENKFPQIACAFSSGTERKQKYKHLLSVVPMDFRDTLDIPIFFYDLHINSNYYVLHGNDINFKVPFPPKNNFNDFITKEYKFCMKNKNYYECLKSLLKISLLYKSVKSTKDSIITNFEKTFKFTLSYDLKELFCNNKYESKNIQNNLKELFEFLKSNYFSEEIIPINQEKSLKIMIKTYHILRDLWSQNKDLDEINKKIILLQKKHDKIQN